VRVRDVVFFREVYCQGETLVFGVVVGANEVGADRVDLYTVYI
jgi:hypothetical protein